VYTSIVRNSFFVTAVADNHFEPDAYSNATGILDEYLWISDHDPAGKAYLDHGYGRYSHDFQLFTSMLEGYNAALRATKTSHLLNA